jgi:hypothetical protein
MKKTNAKPQKFYSNNPSHRRQLKEHTNFDNDNTNGSANTKHALSSTYPKNKKLPSAYAKSMSGAEEV